ncbi:MAG TPA: diacylglycerol kinase family lipid kinase, partial [Anaerolineae bacterium]|nr:diacylglycerol kinase family lipid kinase [Anaerolineae bacterium]
MTHRIILNPYANQGRAQKQIESIRAAYRAVNIEHEIVLTTQPKDAITLAQQAVAQGYTAVVAAGGDGTVNEVVNGLVRGAETGRPTLPLGVIPVGTGNDFAHMLKLPKKMKAIIDNIVAGATRQIDVGYVVIDGATTGHYFGNNCALAMEPMVNMESNRFTRLHGTPRYLAGLVSALFKLKAWQMDVEWEGGRFSGPSVLLSICNGPRAGSTFMMAPDAKADDGLFDVALAEDLSMPQILRVLPGLFNGAYLRHPQVQQFRTAWLKIRVPEGTPIHADGEMVTNSAETITYSIL